MKKIRFTLSTLLLAIILFGPIPKASATPAPTRVFTLTQPDGATLQGPPSSMPGYDLILTV